MAAQQEKKLGLGSVVSISVGLIIATSCLVSLGQGAGTIGVTFIFCNGNCLHIEYDNGRFPFGIECVDAEYNGWTGTVYTRLYGTVSNDYLNGWRIHSM